MNNLAMDALYTMTPRPVDAWLFENTDAFSQLLWQVENHPSFVLPDPSAPVAICGIVPVCGVGSVWLVTGEGFERKAGMVARQLRELCHAAYTVFDLRRLHMLVDSNDAAAKRFAIRLGFVREAERLKNLGARGQDIDIFYLERESA